MLHPTASNITKKSKLLGRAIFILLFMFSLIYAIKTDYLFLNDSRYAASEWIKANVGEDKKIIVFSLPQYLPDIPGSNIYSVQPGNYTREDEIITQIEKIKPDYIIDSSLFYGRYLGYTEKRLAKLNILPFVSHYPEQTKFYNELFSGELDYQIVKSFPDNKEDVPDPEFINPEIIILKRKGI